MTRKELAFLAYANARLAAGTLQDVRPTEIFGENNTIGDAALQYIEESQKALLALETLIKATPSQEELDCGDMFTELDPELAEEWSR